MGSYLNRLVKRLRNTLSSGQSQGRYKARDNSRLRRPLGLERLEDRITPTTAIIFSSTTHVLTITMDAVNETAAFSVTGTMLNVTTDDVGGTTADSAAQALGFAPSTAAGVTNSGSIDASNDVELITIQGFTT